MGYAIVSSHLICRLNIFVMMPLRMKKGRISQTTKMHQLFTQQYCITSMLYKEAALTTGKINTVLLKLYLFCTISSLIEYTLPVEVSSHLIAHFLASSLLYGSLSWGLSVTHNDLAFNFITKRGKHSRNSQEVLHSQPFRIRTRYLRRTKKTAYHRGDHLCQAKPQRHWLRQHLHDLVHRREKMAECYGVGWCFQICAITFLRFGSCTESCISGLRGSGKTSPPTHTYNPAFLGCGPQVKHTHTQIILYFWVAGLR